MINFEEWENRFEKVVRPVFDRVGGHAGSIANDIVGAIRVLQREGKIITPYQVYSQLIHSARQWENIDPSEPLFEACLGYYEDWESLSHKDKDYIKKKRRAKYMPVY